MTSLLDRKKLAEHTLKTRYNVLLEKYWQIEDGTAEIVSSPVYQKLNTELKETAAKIAALSGITGFNNVVRFFRNGEISKGFSEVSNG